MSSPTSSLNALGSEGGGKKSAALAEEIVVSMPKEAPGSGCKIRSGGKD
jgi:hypothetical protein